MLKIIDDFYEDPDAVREMAINAKYELISSGNYIGCDTLDKNIRFPVFDQKVKEMFPVSEYKIVCSRFRSAIEGDTHLAFVHSDSIETGTGYHIIVSLTKEPVEDGLVFYEHVTQGLQGNLTNIKETEDFTVFKPIKVVPYKYNRAVVLDYSYFHSPMHHTGFGKDIASSRLMHITEVCKINSPQYKYRTRLPGACMSIDDEPNRGENNNKTL